MRRTGWIILAIAIVLIASGVFIIVRSKPEPTPLVKEEPIPQPTRRVIGTSVEGRAIDAYTYGTGPKHILFVGGIHGLYENNSTNLANEFIDYLKVNTDTLPVNLTVTIVPNANPDATDRFNANQVDLNRNFDCDWQAEAMWKGNKVSAGTEVFSEPEARAIRDLVRDIEPVAVIFWHSQAGAVYASKCAGEILPETKNIMNIYAKAAGYKAIETFDAYTVTGASEDWLASIGIPAITVELTNHEDTEWDKNLAGIKAIINKYAK